jgi:FixJ family two-component response regulator
MIERTIRAGAAKGVCSERIVSQSVPIARRRMRSANAPDRQSWSAPWARTTPIVFVADEDISVRESLESLIRRAGWRAETFGCAQEFLARPRVFAPSCLVLDATLPGLNGLDLQKQIAVERTDLPIIFVARYVDVPMTVQAMKAGALEFFMKPLRDEVLLSAIGHGIERSQSALREEALARALRECHASLSRREREVMALVVSGLLNKQVAGELDISEITVKAHRGNVMRKMNANSFAALVTMATKLGVAPAPSGFRNRWV